MSGIFFVLRTCLFASLLLIIFVFAERAHMILWDRKAGESQDILQVLLCFTLNMGYMGGIFHKFASEHSQQKETDFHRTWWAALRGVAHKTTFLTITLFSPLYWIGWHFLFYCFLFYPLRGRGFFSCSDHK